jgi:hypothetical protein
LAKTNKNPVTTSHQCVGDVTIEFEKRKKKSPISAPYFKLFRNDAQIQTLRFRVIPYLALIGLLGTKPRIMVKRRLDSYNRLQFLNGLSGNPQTVRLQNWRNQWTW